MIKQQTTPTLTCDVCKKVEVIKGDYYGRDNVFHIRTRKLAPTARKIVDDVCSICASKINKFIKTIPKHK